MLAFGGSRNLTEMHLSLLLPLLWLSSHFSPGHSATDCDPIPICSSFRKVRVDEDNDDQPLIADYQNESQIGSQGHWDGVVPEKYKLDLNFLNRTHYNGSVDITFKIVHPTDRITINHHIMNPHIDYTLIVIKPQCGRRQSRTASPPGGRCIEKATFLESERVLILDLNRANLKINTKYVLSFPSFHGRSQNAYGSKGAIGLREAGTDNGGAMGNFSALTTIFQMRYARTVFPLFDHPSLKAVFELCIERASDVTVASNTLPIDRESKTIGNRKRDCFEPTPKIPSYVFTFSLMKNYASEKIQMPSGLTIELFAPEAGIANLRWILEEAVPVVQYMERITKFKFPLKRLAFVAQYPAPFWGVENFGLVTVDGNHMQAKSELAYTILYHEIVHQWLGNVVTIKDWREICLQEGLTAYFEWQISAERRNGSIDEKANKEKKSTDANMYYEPYALKDYAVTQDIANHCFGRPPIFFHSIAKKEGFGTIERFLAKLIEKEPFGVAGIEEWDQTLDDVAKTEGHSLRGYIKGWFLQPGPLYLTTSKIPGSDCIRVRQKVYGRDDDSETVTVPRPVPLTVQTFGPSSKNPVVLSKLENRVCGIDDSIYLVDPETHTYTRKAYTAVNYRRVLQLQKQNPTSLSERQFSNLVHDFCRALIDDVLPLDDEPTSTRPSDWLEVYQLIKSSSVNLSKACRICVSSKDELQPKRENHWPWNAWCSELRLNVLLGRNYTLGRQ